MKKKLIIAASLALAAVMSCFAFSACSNDKPEEPPEEENPSKNNQTQTQTDKFPTLSEPTVEWDARVWSYKDASGEDATLNYAVYFPAAYSESGEALPLVTYIPDASYARGDATRVQTAACSTLWVTEEIMAEHPAVFLILTLTGASATDKDDDNYLSALRRETSEESQVINIIDSLVEEYNIDENRLYLTGQSMGGIFDWAVNTVYPDKFAATVYIGCQPGGDVSTEEAPVQMYDDIIAAAEFVKQKFVYIASRKDPKAPIGQDDVEAVLTANGVKYVEKYDLLAGASNAAANTETVKELLEANPDCTHFFLGFPQVANGTINNEHMDSFPHGYAITSVYEWLLDQTLEVEVEEEETV